MRKEKRDKEGRLYIVATPIGNLMDITYRALEVLREVDVILAEKPKDSMRLLNHFSIKKTIYECNQHTSIRSIKRFINRMKEGEDIAYITSAGTPCISDPGAMIVDMAYNNDIKVIPIPGASALTSAISVSGFSLKPIIFYGFLSHKSSKRKKILEKIANTHGIFVFYESTHRIQSFLKEIKFFFPNRRILIAREISKVYEDIERINTDEIDFFIEKRKKMLGEFTIVLENNLKRDK